MYYNIYYLKLQVIQQVKWMRFTGGKGKSLISMLIKSVWFLEFIRAWQDG